LLAPRVTEANHREVFERARHRTKRELEDLAASLRPQPDVPSKVWKLPEAPSAVRAPSASLVSRSVPPAAPIIRESPKPAAVQALAPERYKIQLTISGETREKLQRVQDLMRHSVPTGDLAVVFDRALDLLLADLERRKCAATTRPRASGGVSSGSRHIPAAVRRLVWKRDQGQCTFVGARGKCGEKAFVEFHHVRPFAEGGQAVAENIELRCRAHNQYEADLFFGDQFTVREEAPMFDDELGPGPSRLINRANGGVATTRRSGSQRVCRRPWDRRNPSQRAYRTRDGAWTVATARRTTDSAECG
jgi:hypothetical protein